VTRCSCLTGPSSVFPRSKRGVVFLLILISLAGVRLLGEQGARIGPFSFAPIALSWLMGATALAFFLVARSSNRPRPVLLAGLALGLALLYWPLATWPSEALHPVSSLALNASRLSDGTAAPARESSGPLSIESRRDLNRLTGRRRDVLVELSGFLVAPQSGLYRFDVNCDDRCVFRIDGKRLIRTAGFSSEETPLEEGPHSVSIRFEQRDGPAYLLVHWRRPVLLELLPLGHFISSGPNDLTLRQVQEKERRAALSFLASLAWWSGVLALVVGAGESRRMWASLLTEGWRGRFVPVGAASLLILFGAVLRVDALLVRAHLVDTSSIASTVHERLRPLLPDYRAFYRPNFRDSPYRADVRSYLDRAASMGVGNFYEASFREPFYVALVKLFVAFCGGRELGALVQSLFFSIAVLPLVFALAIPLMGRWWALAMLLPLVLHEWLVFEAPSGYRLSAYAFFLICFAAAVFFPVGRHRVLLAVLSGTLGAMVCLIRLSGLSFVTPLLLLAGWEKRREGGWRTVGIAFLTMTIWVGPYLLSCYRAHGDPFYSISFHTQFWLGAEHPQAAARQVSAYRYLVDFHGMEELLKGHLRGLTVLPVRSFWNGLRHFPILDALVISAGVVGLLLSLSTPLRFLPVAYLGHLIPFAYIQNFPSGREPRFVMPAYFFLVLAAGWLGHRLLRWAARGYLSTIRRRD